MKYVIFKHKQHDKYFTRIQTYSESKPKED